MTGHGQKPLALKEWAVAVQALARGDQIFILRKGGIAEETREFELESRAFYLLPGYEHQKTSLVKEPWRGMLEETVKGWTPDRDSVPIFCYAEAVEDYLIHDGSDLDKIRDFHIWTDTFAEERLRWKRLSPLHLIVLRAYELTPAFDAPILSEYAGCKSWIQLETPIPELSRNPVLNDEQFKVRLEQIKNALGHKK